MTEQSIIFFDIDGTLLDHNKELPATAKEAIFQLKEKGRSRDCNRESSIYVR